MVNPVSALKRLCECSEHGGHTCLLLYGRFLILTYISQAHYIASNNVN